ncbi:MAG TPA: MotA/TolQ/ExbB proton channel family protein [bacterium]|nr:MotA/TolQ/ExbB proton channel family protein [bacterium]HOL46874.1 MotA/TolQ/ExbB proton channel family protein [bacterium]HPQ18777.1 MotA/TolQ/ExbB proton channel family protein [bacterium]
MKEKRIKIVFTVIILFIIIALYYVYKKITIINKGGFLMLPLMFCSIYALFVILERYLFLKRIKLNSEELIGKINIAISSNNIDEAYLICEKNPTILSPILIAGLNNFNEPKEKIKEEITEAGLQVIPKLEENLNIILLIAKISPLLGLLGTVTGMIKAFNQIRLLGGNVNATVLAGGISEALLTTAAGLIIAIPLLIFHNFLENKVERIILDIENSAIMLVNSITKSRNKISNEE